MKALWEDCLQPVCMIFIPFLGVLLGCLFLIGCGGGKPEPKPFNEGGYQEKYEGRVTDLMPADAQVVQDLGNDWVIFKLNIFNEDRYFIYNTNGDYSGDAQWSHRAISELRPPKER